MLSACVRPDVFTGSPYTLGSLPGPQGMGWDVAWDVRSGASQRLLNWTELNIHTGLFARLPCCSPGFKCQPRDSWGPPARF